MAEKSQEENQEVDTSTSIDGNERRDTMAAMSRDCVYIFNVKKGGEGKDIFPEAPKELIERAKKLAEKYEIRKK